MKNGEHWLGLEKIGSLPNEEENLISLNLQNPID
jgi:hypothetical protein